MAPAGCVKAPSILPSIAGRPVRLAAPSWVIPGTILENSHFLEGKVEEVALLFFETKSCLDYGERDLPPDLARLDLSWHVHLPTDLPWSEGGRAVARVCLALMEKTAFLGAERAVLHPPRATSPAEVATCEAALAAFGAEWQRGNRNSGDILLENTRDNDLVALGTVIGNEGFGLCPDLGHILAYDQRDFFDMIRGLPDQSRPRMLHCSASGLGGQGNLFADAHCPLDLLDSAGLAVGEALCCSLAANAVIVAELFDWNYSIRSLPVIAQWCSAADAWSIVQD